ncbi:MAG TPA: L-aspartate oxidase [Acidimicrobiales bacterium]|nr:L-aspartate oxidase [Acidimicrobiales bacterium]
MPELDLLVLGSGVAGLSAAVKASVLGLRVGVLTKGDLSQATTRWAQGGVAAVLFGDPDSTDLHLADTLAAGAGLCDVDAVRVLVEEGPARVNDLIALGAVFDRDPGGALALAREGGHSVARVVHAGGAATGAEIERALVAAARTTAASLMERWFAVDLLVDGRCHGVVALDPAGNRHEIRARHTLMASGGAGQLYAVTTNPPEATGDGMAMALRAGVPVADLEFVQFHPTALHHPSVPRPLLSEALRGHGALIRDIDGNQFVDELAPRDVVARAMAGRMLDQGVDHLWLDTTAIEGFEIRFPTIAAALHRAGLDPATDWLPIAPAAHYMIGGVITDLDGATALPGLWAAGEVACTGVHGANRLGSNSLLEGMVFAARVVEAVAGGKEGPDPTGLMSSAHPTRTRRESLSAGAFPRVEAGVKGREALQLEMSAHAGLLRDSTLLAEAATAANMVPSTPASDTVGEWELSNLAVVARALVAAATAREETRGAHNRRDFPERSPAFERHIVLE